VVVAKFQELFPCLVINQTWVIHNAMVVHNEDGVIQLRGSIITLVLTLKGFTRFKCSTFDVGQGGSKWTWID
jgi:hypothetical protein